MMSLRRIVMSSAVQSHRIIWTKGFATKCVETFKASVYERVRDFQVGTVDSIMRQEKMKGVSITHEDLLRWAKRLYFERRPEKALKVMDWMNRKKIESSPEELAFYVEVILKVRGHGVANRYFTKVDPECNMMDFGAKNRPARLVLDNYMIASWRNSDIILK